MLQEFEGVQRLGEIMSLYGKEVVRTLLIVVIGLIAAKYIVRWIGNLIKKLPLKNPVIATVSNVIHVFLIAFVLVLALHYLGARDSVVYRTLIAVSLAAVALIILFRPYIPTLPFKVGDTIEGGGLLGKVEATTVLNTRLRTFDGKTVFVPNRTILNENLVNYSFTPTRQIRLVFGIHYNADLLKAKNVLWEIIAEDPRILESPAPRVFVLNLADSAVELAARPWVRNTNYWRTRCDLIEKVKLRFDQEGITIAFPQRDVHLHREVANVNEQATE
jgi:small conductance mechanosensitive channel